MGNFPFTPDTASTYAQDVNALFYVLLGLTLFFTLIVGSMLMVLTIRYRRGAAVDRSNPPHTDHRLESAWIVAPLFLGLAVFAWAAKLFAVPFTVPKNATEIFVIGKQWMWHLQHTNGVRENNELHVPVDENIKLTMISQDVIHALYVPAFRVQRHVEPDRYTSLWFRPTQIGRYRLFCNNYCGTQHSLMGGWVYVMRKGDYQNWLVSGGAKPVAVGGESTERGGQTMESAGAGLYERYQCSRCHGAEGAASGLGPSLVGIYGKPVKLQDGRSVIADQGFLRKAILDPTSNIIANYPPTMPAYRKVLTEDEVLQLISYIKALGVPAAAAKPGAASLPAANGSRPQRTGGSAGQALQTPGGAGEKPEDVGAARTESSQLRQLYEEQNGARR